MERLGEENLQGRTPSRMETSKETPGKGISLRGISEGKTSWSSTPLARFFKPLADTQSGVADKWYWLSSKSYSTTLP